MSDALSCQRQAFQLGRNDHYFNCAYMGPLPRASEEAGFTAIRQKAVPTRITPPDAFWDTDELRRLYAQLIHAPDPSRVAVQPGVSYAVATAATLAAGAGSATLIAPFPMKSFSPPITYRQFVNSNGWPKFSLTLP